MRCKQNKYLKRAVCTNSTQQPSQSDLLWSMVKVFNGVTFWSYRHKDWQPCRVDSNRVRCEGASRFFQPENLLPRFRLRHLRDLAQETKRTRNWRSCQAWSYPGIRNKLYNIFLSTYSYFFTRPEDSMHRSPPPSLGTGLAVSLWWLRTREQITRVTRKQPKHFDVTSYFLLNKRPIILNNFILSKF